MILSDIITEENLYVMLASLLHEIFAGQRASENAFKHPCHMNWPPKRYVEIIFYLHSAGTVHK